MIMAKSVKLRKQGKFYNAYEDDAYVVNAVLGYKVGNGRVGFPVNAIGKVVSELEDHKINYVVIEQDVEVDKAVFPFNNYNKYFKIGTESVEKAKNYEKLILRIKDLSSDKVDKIINYVNEIIDE